MAEKLAIQRVVRDANGRMNVILIDLNTFQPITDPTGYRVLNQHNTQVEQVADVNNPDAPKESPVTEAPEITPFEGGRDRPGVSQGRFPDRPSAPQQGRVSPTSRQIGSPSLGAPGGSTTPTREESQTLPELDYDRFSPPTARSVTGFGYAGTETAPTTAPGKGMAALVDRGQSRAGFAPAFGPNRPNMPSGQIVGKVQEQVGKTFGPDYSVRGISGEEEEGQQYGSPRHSTGQALDFDVVDPTGQTIRDPNQLSDLASQFAYENPEAGVGFGKGYMSPGRMHLDVAGNPKAWGAGGLGATMAPALRETIAAARQGFQPTQFTNAPTPFSRNETNPNQLRAGALDTQPDFNQEMGTVSVPRESVAQGIVSKARDVTSPAPSTNPFAGRNVADMSPAEYAAAGFAKTRSAEENDLMARAIAGEISPSTYEKAAAGNPEALEHVGNVISSIENRAASKQFENLRGALAPSQYNSLAAENLKTTNANMAQWGSQIKGWMEAFRTGTLQPTDYGITNYYNPAEAQPSWGPQMSSPVGILDHQFGTLPGYEPNESFLSERQRMADAQISEERGFTPSQMGSSFGMSGNRLDSGIGRNDAAGAGRGSSPGGPSLGGRSSAHSQERERDTSLDGSGGFAGGSGRSGTPGGGNQGTSGRGGMTDTRGGSVSAENANRDSGRSQGPSHSQERERDSSASKGGSSTRGGASAGGRNRGEY